jgi:hypothetical protein
MAGRKLSGPDRQAGLSRRGIRLPHAPNPAAVAGAAATDGRGVGVGRGWSRVLPADERRGDSRRRLPGDGKLERRGPRPWPRDLRPHLSGGCYVGPGSRPAARPRARAGAGDLRQADPPGRVCPLGDARRHHGRARQSAVHGLARGARIGVCGARAAGEDHPGVRRIALRVRRRA